jgi:hypothetical protein
MPVNNLTLSLLIIFSLVTGTAQAATFYVAKTGNDGNSCSQAQNQSTPKLTLASGLGCLSAGDRLEIKTGTYARPSANNWPYASGTSWTNSVTIARYGSDKVTVLGWPPLYGNIGYIVFDGIITDATGLEEGLSIHLGAHHIKYTNGEIKNAQHQGIAGTFSDTIISNNIISHVGETAFYDHTFYINGNRIIIENNIIQGSRGCGIQLYGGPSADAVTRNNIFRNGTSQVGCAAILTASNSVRTLIYGNIIYGNSAGGINSFGVNDKIYNNTIYGNGNTQGDPAW